MLATASSGQPYPPSHPNCSGDCEYRIQFYGPSLHCQPADAEAEAALLAEYSKQPTGGEPEYLAVPYAMEGVLPCVVHLSLTKPP